MSEPRCTATTKSGAQCSARLWQDDLCRWHHPSNAGKASENGRKGGRNRSATVRAKKAFSGADQDLAGLWAKTLSAIDRVDRGEMEPSQAQALATLIRAAQSLAGPVIIQNELEQLRQDVAAVKGQGVA
jgi:hypothetical protein